MREGGFRALGWLSLAAVALLYAPTLSYPFVFDDHVLVERNPAVRGLDRAPDIVREALRGGASTIAGEGGAAVDPGYRPVRALSYALDHSLYGMGDGPGELHPWGFRLTNVALHALTVLVLGAIGGLVAGRAAGVVGALLFAVHPLATETVTYVSGRKDGLAALLYLAGLYAALRARARPAWAGGPRLAGALWWLGALAAFGLALGAKEMAVTLPVAALALDLALGGPRGARRRAPQYAVGLAIAVAYAALVVLRTRPGAVGAEAIEPIAPWMLPRLLTIARLVFLYARLIVFPWPQSADYSFDAVPASVGLFEPVTGALSLIGLAAGGAVIARLWRAHARVDAALALLIPLTLLPVLQIVAHPEPVAERYLYLPLAFACLLAGRAVVHLALVGHRPRLALALALGAALALGVGTARRNAVWASERALFEDAARATPRSARANLAFALALRQEGKPREALDALDRAIEVLPQDRPWTSRKGALRVTALFERAVARGQVGLLDLAVADLDRVLAIPDGEGGRLADAPAYAYVHMNRGALLLARAAAREAGGGDEAAAHPDLEASERAYAVALARAAEAARAWGEGTAQAAGAAAPDQAPGDAPFDAAADGEGGAERASDAGTDAEALGALVAIAGQSAVKAAEIATRLGREGDARAHAAAGEAALTRLGDAAARLGAAGGPARARALYHKAALRQHQGDGRAAMRLLVEAARLDPGFAPARLSLSTALDSQGDDAGALALLHGLAREHPRDPGLLGALAAMATRRLRFRDDARRPGGAADPREGGASARAERTDRQRALALYAMAEQAWDQGRRDGALEALEAAAAADPDFAPACEMLGRLLVATRRPLDAVPWLERAARLEPASALAWQRLGDALIRALDGGAPGLAPVAPPVPARPETEASAAFDRLDAAASLAAFGRAEAAAAAASEGTTLAARAAVRAYEVAVELERAQPIARRPILVRRLMALGEARALADDSAGAEAARREAASLAASEAAALEGAAARWLFRLRVGDALQALERAAAVRRAAEVDAGESSE